MMDNAALFGVLKELQVIPLDQLQESLKLAEVKKDFLGDILLDRGLIGEENLGQIIADLNHIPFANLAEISIPEDVLKTVPEIIAKKHKLVAFKKDEQGLHVATANLSGQATFQALAKKTGLSVVTYFTTRDQIENALNLYRQDIKETFAQILEGYIKEAESKRGTEPPIVRIVDTIINYAYKNKASDIHIEPLDIGSLVRFRVDGILHDIVNLPIAIHAQVITRIKVLASLRTDEHQAAQDGKIRFKVDGGSKVDIRVSIVPIIEGEKVVMRLLSEKSRRFSLSDLGISHNDLVKVENAYKKPYGMILATGPTGSGKTTTLYAILKLLNKRGVNVMTIEDPVEYDVEGINQIQVNPKTNLTFAAGLRSLVRQDPDIILVGEIRDEETAGIAINSAMTGHLVLSTLHTNDAATTLPRLADMKIEPFLIASAVNLIIAQRLVRKICHPCRVSYELKPEDLSNFSPEVVKSHFEGREKMRVYRSKGCPVCHQSGYSGRIGIYEVLVIDEEIQKEIVARSAASTIRLLAIKKGMKTMLDDGLEKAKNGITSLEEILRATKE